MISIFNCSLPAMQTKLPSRTIRIGCKRRQILSFSGMVFSWTSPDLPGDKDITAIKLRFSHPLSWWEKKRGGDLSSGERTWLSSPWPFLHCLTFLQHFATLLYPAPLLSFTSGHQRRIQSLIMIYGLALILAHAGTAGGADSRTGLANLQLLLPPKSSQTQLG